MRRKVGLALAFVFCLAATVQAANVVTIGNHVLLPNTPGQVITLNVSGTDQVGGLDFFLQVADGGPGAVGNILAPGISGDILTGMIFASNNTGLNDGNPGGSNFGNEIVLLSTTTNSGTVLANGLLATVTIDTTGFFGGSWPLIMTGTAAGDSDLGVPGNLQTIDGSISVPEPTSVVLGLFAVAGLGVVAIRKRRARRA